MTAAPNKGTAPFVPKLCPSFSYGTVALGAWPLVYWYFYAMLEGAIRRRMAPIRLRMRRSASPSVNANHLDAAGVCYESAGGSSGRLRI